MGDLAHFSCWGRSGHATVFFGIGQFVFDIGWILVRLWAAGGRSCGAFFVRGSVLDIGQFMLDVGQFFSTLDGVWAELGSTEHLSCVRGGFSCHTAAFLDTGQFFVQHCAFGEIGGCGALYCFCSAWGGGRNLVHGAFFAGGGLVMRQFVFDIRQLLFDTGQRLGRIGVHRTRFVRGGAFLVMLQLLSTLDSFCAWHWTGFFRHSVGEGLGGYGALFRVFFLDIGQLSVRYWTVLLFGIGRRGGGGRHCGVVHVRAGDFGHFFSTLDSLDIAHRGGGGVRGAFFGGGGVVVKRQHFST